MSERLRRALKLLRKGDLAAAEREARAALRLAPGDAVAHNVYGLALAERRDHLARHVRAAEFRRPLSSSSSSAIIRKVHQGAGWLKEI